MMKLITLKTRNFRCLRDQSIDLKDLNLFIGANASGKSTILDALRFLQEGVQARDFEAPVFSRGGILNLAWKGEQAHQIDIEVTVQDDGDPCVWSVQITRWGYQFQIKERVERLPPQAPPVVLLEADSGTGWWWSNNTNERIEMQQPPTCCALSAASARCDLSGP